MRLGQHLEDARDLRQFATAGFAEYWCGWKSVVRLSSMPSLQPVRMNHRAFEQRLYFMSVVADRLGVEDKGAQRHLEICDDVAAAPLGFSGTSLGVGKQSDIF